MKTFASISGLVHRRRWFANLLLIIIAVVLLSAMVFRGLLASDTVLFMTDNNLGFTSGLKAGLPESFLSSQWTGGPLLGFLTFMPICLRNLLLWLLPLTGYVNWFHAITMSLASVGLSLFCFRRGCRAVPALFGLITAFWMGSDLTLTYSGHDGKYGILACAGLGLWMIEMAASDKRIPWFVLAGGAVGLMFVEQQDVALFIALFMGVYAVYAILRESAGKWRALPLPLVLMASAALLVGGPNVLSGYLTYVKGIVAMSDENPQQKWEYCTQWSVPPEDTLEFVAPGYRGVQTGEPSGPYWGRQGRSPGWEKTGQGFRNFKLEGLYVGMIPIALALFAILLAASGKREEAGGQTGDRRPQTADRGQKTDDRGQKSEVRSRKSEVRKNGDSDSELRSRTSDLGTPTSDFGWALSQRRGDVIFWGIVTVVALLLAYGKFFPLYSLFYKIPGMSSIRNPNKFLHVFQIGLGILAAFGADALLRGLSENVAQWSRRFGVTLLCVAGVMLIWTVSLASSRGDLVNGFISTGWPAQYAPVMAGNMVSGAFHATVMTLIIGGTILLLVAWRRGQSWKRYLVMTGLILVMVVDVLLLSRHYIKAVSLQGEVGDNAVTSFLKKNLNQQRAYMLSQDGFYNSWLVVLFPYHGIETFNVSQMPRMPEDYSRWLKSAGRDPIRLWQLSAIGYVLAPDTAWQQIQKDPRLAPHFDPVMGFNVFGSGKGLGVAEVPMNQKAQHRILRFKSGLPRFKLFHDWTTVTDDEVGEKLAARGFDPQAQVLIARDAADALPAAPQSTNGLPESLTSVLSPTDARVTATVTLPAVLMFVNKHSADWRVSVDGSPATLLRCNSLCLGVYLEPGRHEVRFYLRKQNGLFWTEASGLLICLLALVWLWVPRKVKPEMDVVRVK